MAKMGFKHVKLALYHRGCFCSQSTEKYPDIKLKQVSPTTVLTEDEHNVVYNILWNVIAPSGGHLEEYLQGARKFYGLKDIEVLDRKNSSALILTKIKGPNSSQERVIKRGGIYLSPVDVENGFEIHSVITPNAKYLRNILKELDGIGDVKMVKIHDYAPQKLNTSLTPKQTEVIKFAWSRNYYNWPRRITLEDMASELNLSRRAFQERLRKAESKLFPELIKDYVLSQKGN